MAMAGTEPLPAICMPQGHGIAMECARRTMGGHGLPGQALESGHA
jgi:hypothetical protein